jgi:hypothetical protein
MKPAITAKLAQSVVEYYEKACLQMESVRRACMPRLRAQRDPGVAQAIG